MPTSPNSENRIFPRRVMRTALVIALGLLAVYIYLDLAGYLNLPWMRTFPAPWNDNIVYILIILAANAASVLGFLLTQQFTVQEPQRRIWFFFASGLGFWVLGEISSFFYNQIYSVLPDLTLTDLFWTVGYICFGLSLYYQYILIYIRGNIYRPIKRTRLPFFFLIVLLVLVVTLVVTILVRQASPQNDEVWYSTYLFVLYPICDLVEGLAALWFAFLFRRGLLGRPWFGLLAFAVSDGISTWYWMGGSKLLNLQSDTWLSLFTDVLYIGGYLLAAWGCLSIFFMLKYGYSPQSAKASNPVAPK
jgi:hypothetical protein